jgi:hypothetical protein
MEDSEIIKYLDRQEEKLPDNLIDNNYWLGYLWSKSSRYFFNGPDKYKAGDYFGYPRKNWSRIQLRRISFQLINMKGVSQTNPIRTKTLVNIHEALTLFHFDVVAYTLVDFNELIVEVEAIHKIAQFKIKLFFKLEEMLPSITFY